MVEMGLIFLLLQTDNWNEMDESRQNGSHGETDCIAFLISIDNSTIKQQAGLLKCLFERSQVDKNAGKVEVLWPGNKCLKTSAA